MRKITAIRLVMIWLAVMSVYSFIQAHYMTEIAASDRLLAAVDEKYLDLAKDGLTGSLTLVLAGTLMGAVSICQFAFSSRNAAAMNYFTAAKPCEASILNSTVFAVIGWVSFTSGHNYFQLNSTSLDISMNYNYIENRREGQLIAATYGELSNLFTTMHYIQFTYALILFVISVVAMIKLVQQVIQFFQLPLIKWQMTVYKYNLNNKTIEVMETLKPHTDKISKKIMSTWVKKPSITKN